MSSDQKKPHGGSTGKNERQDKVPMGQSYTNPEYQPDKSSEGQAQADLAAMFQSLQMSFTSQLDQMRLELSKQQEKGQQRIEKELKQQRAEIDQLAKPLKQQQSDEGKGVPQASPDQGKWDEIPGVYGTAKVKREKAGKGEQRFTMPEKPNVPQPNGDSDHEDDRMSFSYPMDEADLPSKDQARAHEVRQLQDFPSYEAYQDLHLYFQQVENSYIGAINDDYTKIFKVLNKFHKVQHIYQSAHTLAQTYKSYSRWRSKLLSMFGRTSDDVFVEFEQAQREKGEKMTAYMDRLYAILSFPAAKQTQSEIRSLIIQKLPEYYRTILRRSQLRDFYRIRQKVAELEADPQHRRLEDLQEFVERLNTEQGTSFPTRDEGQSSQGGYGSQGRTGQGRGYPRGGRYQYRGGRGNRDGQRSQQNNSQNNKSRNDQAGDGTFYGGEKVPDDYDQHQGCLYIGEKERQVKVLSRPEYTSTAQNQASRKIVTAIKDEHYPVETRAQARARQSAMSGIPEQDSFNTTAQPQQETIQQDDYRDTAMGDGTENQQNPRNSSENINRGFQYLNRQQPSHEDLNRRVFEARYNQESTVLLDRGTFSDSQGVINLSRMRKSVCLPVSIEELENMEKLAKQGHCPVYIQNDQNRGKSGKLVDNGSQLKSAETVASTQAEQIFLQQMELQGQLASTISRVETSGEHLLVKIIIQGQTISAVVDTGAVRSIASQSLVVRLQNQQEIQEVPYEFSGISGDTSAQTFLRGINMQIGKQYLNIDLPVVETNSFQLLLGQDVLRNTLNDCSIHLGTLRLSFLIMQGGSTLVCELPLETKANKNKENILYSSFQTQCIDKLWPSISKVEGPYDVALLDLPLKGPKFFGRKIPYETQSVKDFAFFKFVLDEIMKPDCVLLLWCSGRTFQEICQLLGMWQYTFVSILVVWVKMKENGQPVLGMGYWTRANIEFVVMAKKGVGINSLRGKNRSIPQSFYTMFEQPGDQHSSKPVHEYSVYKEIFNLEKSKNIELFAREKDCVDQTRFWDLYGNEIEGYFKLRDSRVQKCIQHDQPKLPIFYVELTEAQKAAMVYLPEAKRVKFQELIEGLEMEESFKHNPEVLRVFAQQLEVFDYDGKVGKARNIQLDLHFKPKSRVARSVDIRYDKDRDEFLKNKIKEWEKNRVVYKGFARYLFSPVIVDKRGSKEKYRLCFNFQPLNEALEDEWFQARDADQIIAQMKKAKYKCVIDMPAAHQQIWLKDYLRKTIGLKTPEGVYVSNTGQFGMLTISKVFGKGVKLSIGHLENKGVEPYADDIFIFGETIEECIALLEETFQSLRKDGYVISAKKCTFFQQELNVLGQVVKDGEVCVDQKRLEAIEQLPIPKNKEAIQRFIGSVNYLRKYIPIITNVMVPLYDSLKQSEGNILKLTELQIKVFLEVKKLVMENAVLALPSTNKPFYIAVSYSTFGYAAALYQKEQKSLRPVAFWSKTRATEVFKPQYVHKLLAVVQVLKAWKYIIGKQKIILMIENQLLKMCLAYRGDNIELNKLQIAIWEFDVEIQVKAEKFKGMQLAQCLVGTQLDQQMDKIEDLMNAYEKQRILPSATNKKSEVQIDFKDYEGTFFFDGACTRKRGEAGIGAWAFVQYSQSGEIVFKESGEMTAPMDATNNVAESFALLQVAHRIRAQFDKQCKIQIVGDSQLVLRQMAGEYRVNSNDLRLLQREIKGLLRGFKRIKLQHVPREQNETANVLAQKCLQSVLTKELEQTKEQVFYIQPDIIEHIQCIVCGSIEAEGMNLCDHCGLGQHSACLGELAYPPKGSFFCKNCEHYIYQEDNTLDVAEDQLFKDYLEGKELKLSKEQRDKYKGLAKFYFLYNDQLHFQLEDDFRRVPSIAERHLVSIQLHQALGHAGQAATLMQIKKVYFWPGMATDVQAWVKQCLICQAKRSPYLPMPRVSPLFKGLNVWAFVAVDLIEIRSVDESKIKYVMSAVCAYSKFVELVAVKDKKASTIRDAFRDQVVMRYGCPSVVRSDGGTEFQKEFDEMLSNYKIFHTKLGPRYPQGNGQIERINGIVKSKLQSLYNSEEYSNKWTELLQTIAFGIRIARSRASGYSPFEILYGRDPVLPGHAEKVQQDCFIEPSEERLTYLLNELIEKHEWNHKRVKENLEKMDKEIINEVEKREFRGLT